MLSKAPSREGGYERPLHPTMLGRISLATDAGAVETGTIHIVKVTFGKVRLPVWRKSVNVIPRLDRGK